MPYWVKAHKNWKYERAPSKEFVLQVIAAYGMTEYRFEKFFGLSRYTIKKVKRNKRNIPLEYWHIFYEYKKYIEKIHPAISNEKKLTQRLAELLDEKPLSD